MKEKEPFARKLGRVTAGVGLGMFIAATSVSCPQPTNEPGQQITYYTLDIYVGERQVASVKVPEGSSKTVTELRNEYQDSVPDGMEFDSYRTDGGITKNGDTFTITGNGIVYLTLKEQQQEQDNSGSTGGNSGSTGGDSGSQVTKIRTHLEIDVYNGTQAQGGSHATISTINPEAPEETTWGELLDPENGYITEDQYNTILGYAPTDMEPDFDLSGIELNRPIDANKHVLSVFWKAKENTQEPPEPTPVENDVNLNTFTPGADNIVVPTVAQTFVGGGIAANDIKNVLQPKLKSQGLDLLDGYRKFQTEYSDNAAIAQLVGAEEAYLQAMNEITDARGYYDTMSQTTADYFANAVSANFGQLLTAYQAGNYCKHDNKTGNISAPVFVSAYNTISDKTGLPSVTLTDSDVSTYIEGCVTALRGRLLTQLNTITQNGMNIQNNKDKIATLNGILLNQIGEDIAQFAAMVDNYEFINVDESEFAFNTWGISVAQAAPQQKAGVLMANFNPAFIKGRGRDEITTA